MKSETHRKRMDDRRAWYHDQPAPYKVPVTANLGRAHPDYGVHPHTHAANKAARLA